MIYYNKILIRIFSTKRKIFSTTTRALCSTKANECSLKYIRFIQKKKQLNRIFSLGSNASTNDSEQKKLESSKRVPETHAFKGGRTFVFLNQGLKSSQFMKMQADFKRLGINTKKVPHRLWSKSVFLQESSRFDLKKHIYGELFLLYEMKRSSIFGRESLNLVYDEMIRSFFSSSSASFKPGNLAEIKKT